MKKVIIYHNPRCSKSRETLALLRENGVEPTVIEYLKQTPTKNEIRAFITMLGGDPHALLRAKESAYSELGLTPESSEQEVVEAIVKHPVLMERPLVVHGKKAALGRPPENVLSIL